MKSLEELDFELNLSPTNKVLLANTGSMTALLEALFGPVSIETVLQEITKAKPDIAAVLKIPVNEPINHRVVKIIAEKTIVYATSFAPLSALSKDIREDIVKRDEPIGKIMEKHSMESRRELLGFDWLKADAAFAEIFGFLVDSILLKRKYNIIHQGKPLISITEMFPSNLVQKI